MLGWCLGGRMGGRREPIIFGLDKGGSLQRIVHKTLIGMGFVPLFILRLIVKIMRSLLTDIVKLRSAKR